MQIGAYQFLALLHPSLLLRFVAAAVVKMQFRLLLRILLVRWLAIHAQVAILRFLKLFNP